MFSQINRISQTTGAPLLCLAKSIYLYFNLLYRCGEVFCGKCSQFRRRLSLFATPDPDGKSYRVGTNCIVFVVLTGMISYSLRSSLAACLAGAYPSFCSTKQSGVFLLPLDGLLVLHRAIPTYPLIHLTPELLKGWIMLSTG